MSRFKVTLNGSFYVDFPDTPDDDAISEINGIFRGDSKQYLLSELEGCSFFELVPEEGGSAWEEVVTDVEFQPDAGDLLDALESDMEDEDEDD